MAQAEIVKGFFRRFRRGAALCKIPFWHDLTRVYNVLETIEGDGLIAIDKPRALAGLGWRIRLTTDKYAQPVEPRPFALTLDGNTASVRWCWYMRGPVWVEREEEPTFELSGTDVVLCAKINTETGEVTLDDTPDAAVPDTSEFFRAPLYKLERAASDDAWRVAVDLRPGCLVMWV